MNAHAFEFSQAFNYTEMARFGRGVCVEVTLVANSLMTPTLRVRVDSAASFCMFGLLWPGMLALDWEAGDPVTIGTATGTFSAYHHDVTIDLLNYEWTAGIAFAEWDTTALSRAHDVLGLTGFFDHFLVTIDDLSETTYLNPRF